MSSLNDHIERDKKIIEDPTASAQSRRHAESELKDLEQYKSNHPGEDYDPTPLELFCDLNPHEPECRMYED
jgi:hypothetical protein